MSAEKDIANMKKVLEKIKAATGSKNNMKVYGDFAAKLIRTRTKLGWGVKKQGGIKFRFQTSAPLSDSYIRFRQLHKPKGKTSARKSNLTYSGDMTDAISAEHSRQNKVTMGLGGDSIEEEKAKWAAEGTKDREPRPFLFLSRAELKQVFQFMKKTMIKLTLKLK